MLRGRENESGQPVKASTAKPVGAELAGFPGLDQPYAIDERPPGILFYRAKEGFFLPYTLLQSMKCERAQLTLKFASDDVLITGRGLHELYVQLAAHRVWRVVEQGERYAQVSEMALFVATLERIPRTRKQKGQGDKEDESAL